MVKKFKRFGKIRKVKRIEGTDVNIQDIIKIAIGEQTDIPLVVEDKTTGRRLYIPLKDIGTPIVAFIYKSAQQTPVNDITQQQPALIVPDQGYHVLIPQDMVVTVSGVDTTNGETITVQIDFVAHDGEIRTKTLTFSADGTVPLEPRDIKDMIASGKALAGLQLWATTSLTTSNATVTLELIGQEY